MRPIIQPARALGILVLAAAGFAVAGTVSGGGGAEAAVSLPTTPVADAEADDIVDERVVIDEGHVDAVAPRLVDGEFRTLFKDSRDPAAVVWREPTSVVMHLTPAGRQTIPDPPGSLGFLGEPGDSFHLIPQVQNPEVLWAGWNTEAFAATDIDGRFTLSLDEIEGPGEVVVWGWSAFGQPLMRFDGRDGLPDAYPVPAGTHEHANWAFTEEGVYRMTFTFSVTLASGEQASDSEVFTMAVGDVDPDDVSLPGDGGDTSGGTTDGGTTDGGTTDGGPGGGDDGGAADGGAGGGAASGGSGGATDTGGTDGGSADGGSAGSTGGSSGGTDGGSSGGDPEGVSGSSGGGSTGDTTGNSSTGGSATGGSGSSGTAGGKSPDGGLAQTGSGAVVPLALLSAALIGTGAGVYVLLNRRGRAARRTAPPPDAAGA